MADRPGTLVLLAVLGAAFLSMLIYAVRGRGKDVDAARRGSRFLLGAGDFLLHWFLWLLGPADGLARRLGLTPDFFNFAGLGFGALSGLLIAWGHLAAGGAAVALGGVCDIMDGRVARARQVSSDYGKFIDATLDRFVEVFAFLGFLVYLRRFPTGPLAAGAAISGSLLVSYARARGESVGVLCREGLMQRAERLALTAIVSICDGAVTAHFGWPEGVLVYWTVVVIAAGTFGTAIHRTVWIASRLRDRS